jgi:hypothetical protein
MSCRLLIFLALSGCYGSLVPACRNAESAEHAALRTGSPMRGDAPIFRILDAPAGPVFSDAEIRALENLEPLPLLP